MNTPHHHASVPATCACGEHLGSVVLEARFNRVGLQDYPFRTIRCEACQLVRTDPVPDGSHYLDTDFTERHLHDGADYAPIVLERLMRRRAAGRFLDVGCNLGNLVEVALERGFDAQGIDVDPLSTALARERGLPIITGDVCDLVSTYDVVVLNHVLEHINEPKTFLRCVADRLEPDGMLFVFVPNHVGLVPRLMGPSWMAWAPHEHVWHFTTTTLRALVEGATALRSVAMETRLPMDPPSPGMKGRMKKGLQVAARSLGMGEQIEGVFKAR